LSPASGRDRIRLRSGLFLAENATGKRLEAQRLRVELGFLVARRGRVRGALTVGRSTTGRVRPGGKRFHQISLLLGLEDLDREVVRIERTVGNLGMPRRSRVGGGAVQLRERNVLLVDGQGDSSDESVAGYPTAPDDIDRRVLWNGTNGPSPSRPRDTDVVRARTVLLGDQMSRGFSTCTATTRTR